MKGIGFLKKKSNLVVIFIIHSSIVHADINEYIPLLYEKYIIKERQCLSGALEIKPTADEVDFLKRLNPKDINAYAIKKGIDHKINCTSKELVQLLHTAWAAHRARSFDTSVNNFDHLLDSVVDPRYLDAIIHLGSVSQKTIDKLDQIEYFQKPFDIESRPWE